MARIAGIVLGLVLLAALVGPAAGTLRAPRVAIVVGPAGELTGLYRSIGVRAAREARRWTSDVVLVASPDATWPAVKRALRGASVVLYLGHGNGWPSRYRHHLEPTTEDGLGLNPVAGRDDVAHRYYGEAFLAREVHLAPGAVVILNHLCYASGNAEPGLPEGSLAVGRQRVDNHAAGWIRAGAGAVIADTFGDPAAYLRPILSGVQTVERIWRAAPDAHGHVLAFASLRSTGYRAAMDPTHPSSGFDRSIVWWPGLDAPTVRAGAGLIATVTPDGQRERVPSLAELGVRFGRPALAPGGPPDRGLVAGTRAELSLPIVAPRDMALREMPLPSPLRLAVRWTLVLTDPGGGAGQDGAPGPAATPAGVRATTTPTIGGRPTPNASPIAAPTPIEPPPIRTALPEKVGAMVGPLVARLAADRIRVGLILPNAPGSYRLTTTILDERGGPFDPATQGPIPSLIVEVEPALSVTYGLTASLLANPGEPIDVAVRVANDGSLAWADPPDPVELDEETFDRTRARRHPPTRLVGHWLALTAAAPEGGAAPDDVSLALDVDPGAERTVVLQLRAPNAPGSYLLIVDIVSPLHGSLAATGVPPGLVRVTVRQPATPGAP